LPIITKRISLYGNNEDLTKEFQKLVDRYKNIEPKIDIDPEIITSHELKDNPGGEYGYDIRNKQSFDFKETQLVSP
jgi:hypothetical protein